MVKVKKVRIVLPVEGTKSYKDILELLSEDNEYVLEKKKSVKQVLKEYQVEGTPIYPTYVVMKEGLNDELKLYGVKFSITPDGYLGNEFELVSNWTIKKELLEKIKYRFQKMIEKYPRLSYGDVDLGILMGTVVYGEEPEVRNPGQLLLFTNTDDIGETFFMSLKEYNDYLKKQKIKQWKEEELERQKELTRKYYEELEKERKKRREYQEGKR